jgi:drug/metabolite transporter superfamily protein YnfA
MIKSLAFFFAAGLCEIGGGYLVWLWLRESKPISFALWSGVAGSLRRVPTMPFKLLKTLTVREVGGAQPILSGYHNGRAKPILTTGGKANA